MSSWINKTIMIVFSFCLATLSVAALTPEDNHFINAYYAKTISLDFKNASLTEVLKIFSKQSQMNFIADDAVANKRVTLYLVDVPIEEALEKVLSANDLDYTLDPSSNIFVVHPKSKSGDEIITRFYQIKHEFLGMSGIKKALDSFQVGGSSGSSSSEDAASEGASGSASPVAGPMMFGFGGPSAGASPSKSSSSPQDFVGILKSLLSDQGKLMTVPQTNTIIITDVSSRFPAIEEMINKLDVEAPEVLIEVEMLDISKQTSELMGAKFSDTIFRFQGANKASLFPFDQSAILNNSKGALEGEDTGAYTLGNLNFQDMTVIINFLRTRSDTKNLARPRIRTMNNEMAQIAISSNEAIGVKQEQSGSTTSSIVTQEAEREPTGVFLNVLPQANPITREIIMAINPKVIESRVGRTFGSTNFRDVEERSVKSILKVKDGETIMIGGLMRSDDSNISTKVPILGSIPILGAAFRHKNNSNIKRELVVFLTPHIMDNKNSFVTQSLKDYEDRNIEDN